jgi:hypothetical protein
MQFSEMVQWITRTTKRPDKSQDIKDAVNSAIENFSLTATFANDLVEFTHRYTDNTAYTQSLSISDLFTRFRKLKYLKQTGAKCYITWCDPQNIFVNGCEQLNRWYRSGNNIIFKRDKLIATLEVGYYSYPERLTLDTDQHWMLEIMPTTIHDQAASRIFFIIGENDDAIRFAALAKDAFQKNKEDFEDSAVIRS